MTILCNLCKKFVLPNCSALLPEVAMCVGPKHAASTVHRPKLCHGAGARLRWLPCAAAAAGSVSGTGANTRRFMPASPANARAIVAQSERGAPAPRRRDQHGGLYHHERLRGYRGIIMGVRSAGACDRLVQPCLSAHVAGCGGARVAGPGDERHGRRGASRAPPLAAAA